jgi:hypothetical protein
MRGKLLEQTINQKTLQACKVLFGSHIHITRDFLCYIRASGVKTAYRKKALETHPDLNIVSEDDFRSVLDAYQLLMDIVSAAEKEERKNSGESRSSQEFFYSWAIPSRYLLFGQFLYYSGTISLKTLVRAITWQKSQRPAIGQIALKWGYFERETLYTILKQKLPGEKFGDCALRLGIIDEFKRLALIGKQRNLQSLFGSFFVENNIMTSSDVEYNLQQQRKHNLYNTKRGKYENG